MQCVERRLLPQAKITSITDVQLLQWLHGEQQHPFIRLGTSMRISSP